MSQQAGRTMRERHGEGDPRAPEVRGVEATEDRLRQTVDQVTVRLDEAIARRDWPTAVGVIGAHWSVLLDEAVDLLDRALTVIPLNAIVTDVRAAAVRDIRLHAPTDFVDRVLGEVALPDADDAGALDALARSERALGVLSVVSSRMIAFRVRGLLTRALPLATLVERFGRIAAVHQPELIGPRLPAALLQSGITRGLADDQPGAVLSLTDAYERGPSSPVSYVQRDAAAKLALFHGLAGDIDLAERWVRRHDETPDTPGWHRSRIELSVDLARSLIMTEELHHDEARVAVQRLEQSVNSEQNWAAAVAYAQARYALAWGDRLGAADKIGRERTHYADWLGDGEGVGPLLLQSEVDLLLATRQSGKARAVVGALDRSADHPAVLVTRARLAVHAGDARGAARQAATVLDQSVSTRTRVDALVVSAVANDRLGSAAARASALDHLEDAVREHRLQLPALALPPEARAEVSAVRSDQDARDLTVDQGERVRITAQQRVLLDGLHRGLGLAEIAAQAHVSVNTMKTHRRALFRRLDAASTDEAISKAREAGLL